MSFWQGLKDVLGPICGASVGALVTGLNLSKEGTRFLWSLCCIGFAALAISGGGPKKETPQLPAGGQQQQQAAQRQKRAPRQPNNRGARRGNRGGNRAARPGFILAKTRRGEVRIYTPDSAIDVDYEVY
jgi:hypothetical protein